MLYGTQTKEGDVLGVRKGNYGMTFVDIYSFTDLNRYFFGGGGGKKMTGHDDILRTRGFEG